MYGVVLHAHPVRGESHNQRNTTGQVATISIGTTENYEFDKIRTAGVTGNATNYKNSQGDNPICSTRDEISKPSRPFSSRAATGHKWQGNVSFGYRKDMCAYKKEKQF